MNVTYEPLNNSVEWKKKYRYVWFSLNRQSLILGISDNSSAMYPRAEYSCEVVSPDVMKTKLEESRKREMAGNKL